MLMPDLQANPGDQTSALNLAIQKGLQVGLGFRAAENESEVDR